MTFAGIALQTAALPEMTFSLTCEGYADLGEVTMSETLRY